jgi:hypothetical protein
MFLEGLALLSVLAAFVSGIFCAASPNAVLRLSPALDEAALVKVLESAFRGRYAVSWGMAQQTYAQRYIHGSFARVKVKNNALSGVNVRIRHRHDVGRTILDMSADSGSNVGFAVVLCLVLLPLVPLLMVYLFAAALSLKREIRAAVAAAGLLILVEGASLASPPRPTPGWPVDRGGSVPLPAAAPAPGATGQACPFCGAPIRRVPDSGRPWCDRCRVHPYG